MWGNLVSPLFFRILGSKIKVMLYEFKNYNKHGNIRTRVVSWPKGKAFGVNPSGLGGYIGVRVFKYEYHHEINPPSLANIGGKRYILPTWKEVLPETELSDIKWIKPKLKVKQEPIVETHTSSSNANKTYKTIYYPESGKFHCDCPGRWRAFDNRCKHIKALEKKVKVS
jgi:hypothetical protein